MTPSYLPTGACPRYEVAAVSEQNSGELFGLVTFTLTFALCVYLLREPYNQAVVTVLVSHCVKRRVKQISF